MTLLFAYVDDNYVMQVSDERVSMWNPTARRWELRDDETTKQVLVGGSLLLSFTGVVDLDGGVPTTEWLARELSDNTVDLADAVAAVSRRLTDIFLRLRYRGQVLVVLIAGWVETSGNELRPIFGHISNQNPQTCERMSSFDHLVGTLDPGAIWVSRGQPLTHDAESRLHRTITAALSTGVSPPVVQRLFLAAMRSCASSNALVGPSAQIGVLPRAAVTRAQADPDNVWVFENSEGAVIPGAAMFIRVPADTDRTVPVRPFIPDD